MASPRTRPADAAMTRLRQQLIRLGQEVRSVRNGIGWTQAALARRTRTSQPSVARLEAGDVSVALAIVVRVLAALGHDLPIRTYPSTDVGLRDSGQLPMAEEIRRRAHRSLRVLFEDPTGEGGQAADIVVLSSEVATHFELESGLSDLERQLRRGRLKRDALERRYQRKIAFVLVLRDTERNRRAVAVHQLLIKAALPASSREILAALERGTPLGRDGLLWIRASRGA